MKPIFVIYCDLQATPDQRDAIRKEHEYMSEDYHVVVLSNAWACHVFKGNDKRERHVAQL